MGRETPKVWETPISYLNISYLNKYVEVFEPWQKRPIL